MLQRRSISHPSRAGAALLAAALAGVTLAPVARAGAGHAHDRGAHVPRPQRLPLAEARAELRRVRDRAPTPPPGVTDVGPDELFGPIGDRGLAYSAKLRALEGRPVRIAGYMVRQDQPVPGLLLLAPFPFQLHEGEHGLAEDLPAALVHVRVPDQAGDLVPFTPGPLLLTGELDLGPREEPDGRISTVRLALHPRPPAAPQHVDSPKEEEQ